MLVNDTGTMHRAPIGARMVEISGMNRAPLPKKRGHRELWVVGLLVLPLVVLGFVLAAMGVLVDPPPDPTPTSMTAPGSPVATTGSPEATPAPGAGIDEPTAYLHGRATGIRFTIIG